MKYFKKYGNISEIFHEIFHHQKIPYFIHHYTRNIVQLIMERKMSLFGHICRMKDNRLVKCVVFGMMDGQTRRGRLSREWWTTSENGVNWTSTLSARWRRTGHSGERLSDEHWTPTGVSPWNDGWMDGLYPKRPTSQTSPSRNNNIILQVLLKCSCEKFRL